MEYCVRAWHSAHLPVARTISAVGCSVSTFGRARLRRKAASINANAITTAMKTDRKDIATLSWKRQSIVSHRGGHYCSWIAELIREINCDIWKIASRLLEETMQIPHDRNRTGADGHQVAPASATANRTECVRTDSIASLKPAMGNAFVDIAGMRPLAFSGSALNHARMRRPDAAQNVFKSEGCVLRLAFIDRCVGMVV